MATIEQRRTERQADRRFAPRAASGWTALALFLLLTLEEFVWGTARLDRALTNLLEHPDTHLLDRISSVFTTVGSMQVTALLALVAVALLWRRGATRPALAVVGAFALALAVEGALKLLLHHPDVPNPLSPPSAPPPANSFPSGHVLRVCVLVTAASLLWPRAGVRVGALLVVALVAYTRVYAGMHWTSDVLAALLLGWALHVAATAYARAPQPALRR